MLTFLLFRKTNFSQLVIILYFLGLVMFFYKGLKRSNVAHKGFGVFELHEELEVLLSPWNHSRSCLLSHQVLTLTVWLLVESAYPVPGTSSRSCCQLAVCFTVVDRLLVDGQACRHAPELYDGDDDLSLKDSFNISLWKVLLLIATRDKTLTYSWSLKVRVFRVFKEVVKLTLYVIYYQYVEYDLELHKTFHFMPRSI